MLDGYLLGILIKILEKILVWIKINFIIKAMDLFIYIIKSHNYINKDLLFSKNVLINDQINVYYMENQIILEGNEYLNIIKCDIHMINNISNIIKFTFNNISLFLRFNIYLNLITKDISTVLLNYIIENGETYQNYNYNRYI